jgi:hypothetical protein
MRITHLVSALTLSLGLVGGPVLAGDAVTGDYLEARSCNVFIGGCHYGAEFVTTGREALMAWNVRSGSHNGVDLTGLSAVAVVAADLNLAEAQAKRSTLLYIDARATAAQRAALADLVRQKCGTAFGKLVAVRTAPIQFAKSEKDYSLQVGDVATLAVKKTVDDTCCLQPMETWYRPLTAINGSTVGLASLNEFKGSGLATTWSRANQNSAFYGQFAF